MRGDITLFILKTLQETSISVKEVADLLDYYSIRNTNARFWGNTKKAPPKRKPIFEDKIIALERHRRISKMIHKLQRDGLVKKNNEGLLGITTRGFSKLKNILQLRNQRPHYKTTSSNEVKIITFDIPEKKRSSRLWLRKALKDLGFNFLQKSVWVGKAMLPEEFLNDLRQKEIFDFVEILAVTTKGTLKPIQ